ncbi:MULTISPECIES: FmdB family zinc ribbon protein [unclassified Limnohabitans]|jgi:putative FmdB family regulatory protein|uniref:FmdB family zinc ribbon protein n=1 Tax=unclassified Limnohabitans TaxID=2626134 RepID=UPI0006DC68A6|nr:MULTISPECIES: FmdB family zinc ribbon protein [unclassified Limnohabitans]ALK91210.1 Zinc ribbon domain protein [Limnohabitans sp. 103DPR2]MBU3721361.1 zinc ribbon domain-containing protein [Limnohabitans sp.]NDD24185.1 zinc ribbon domain-containing protein [Betaproteobacteria bacterium]PUE35239.1 FmdB family transcriptional regulator [Limnohabitans sp. Hippo4]
MPIYAYKCDSCGHAKDVLQKMSDDPLTKCPSCGAPTFNKQLTAAGFQLKGNGWYATDFKGGSSGTSAPAVAGAGAGAASTSSDAGGSTPSAEPSASAAPAACGASCACH